MLRAFAIAAVAVIITAPAGVAQENHQITDAKFLPASSADKQFVSRAHCANPVSQTFGGVTTWHFCFDTGSRFGLIIRQAGFRKAPTARLVEILSDMRVSEIFVPYHSGSPRFFDISDDSYPLLRLSAADCPAPRKIIGGGRVCKELRDRGLA